MTEGTLFLVLAVVIAACCVAISALVNANRVLRQIKEMVDD